MRVVFNYDKNNRISQPCTIALGTFDGIHQGHLQLIEELKKQKQRYGCQTIVYTFLTHPLQVLEPEKAPSQIMLLSEKIKEFSRLGIDILVLNSFDHAFLHQTPRIFMDQLYERYHIKAIVVGFNFHFGYQGTGDKTFLETESKEKGWDLICVPPVRFEDKVVSSTLIRSFLSEGKVEEAAKMMTRPYCIRGKVIHGYGRGREMGFPTANLQFSNRKVLPKSGVYLAKCRLNGKMFWGMTNVGRNPTFSAKGLSIETYLPNFDGDLYGQTMSIFFLTRLREEMKFERVSDLTKQMKQDVKNVKKLIYISNWLC